MNTACGESIEIAFCAAVVYWASPVRPAAPSAEEDHLPRPVRNQRVCKAEESQFKGHKAVAANPFWQELYNLLVELRELQLICCPDSWSHQQESRISGMNADLKQMYEQFSGGITFKNFPDIEAQQSFELAHAWAEQREPAFDYSPMNVLSADPNEWNNRFFITFGDSPFVE
jgi:hypothetical protein